MLDRSKITKQAMLKNIVGRAVYVINGRHATFNIVGYDGGIPYGFCKSKGLWGHLYPRYIETEFGETILADQILIK